MKTLIHSALLAGLVAGSFTAAAHAGPFDPPPYYPPVIIQQPVQLPKPISLAPIATPVFPRPYRVQPAPQAARAAPAVAVRAQLAH